jgi:hypothetical protein
VSKIVEIPNMLLWSQSIGGLIINFGIIEFQSLRWIEKLDGVPAALKARRDKLSLRINAVVALIPSSSLADIDQRKARDLWTEVNSLSATRNRIAHNPICVSRGANTGEAVLSIIDLKKMSPTSDNPLETLDYSQIASIALRVREIGRQLSALIESVR